jgi:hypothetical protein
MNGSCKVLRDRSIHRGADGSSSTLPSAHALRKRPAA